MMSSSEPMGKPSILRNSGSFNVSRSFSVKIGAPFVVMSKGHAKAGDHPIMGCQFLIEQPF